MFSSEVKIISVGSNKEGCHRELISSTSDYIKSQTPVQDQKYCGSNKFNHKYNNNKHIGNSKYNGNNKYVKKANKYQISNCEKVYLNNNNNTTSKNLNLPNNKTTLNINNNINNNNNNKNNNSKIIDNNNSIVNKLELSPSRTKSHSGKFECSIHSKSPSKDSMVMNNTPKTTQALTVTTSAPVSPASYSLDFLHSVGVQMTAGTNRSYTPSASPSRHPNLINAAGTHQCGFVVTTSEDSSTAVVANSSNNTACSSTLNGHAKPATTATYKEYNFSSPMNTSNSQNPNNGMSMPPTGSFSYRNTYGYPVHNYPNHNGARNYNAHFQYHSVSGHNFNGYNRGQIQKKSWTGINQVSFKKCCNMSGNKYGSVSSSNLNSPQTIPRTRNQQNLRNVTYIHTHTGRIIGNSRSPTPSPKSESPSLYKAQQMQECNAIVQGNSMDQGSLIATSAPSIDMSNTNGAMNGYDSDSSHSSYRHNEFAYRSKSLAVSPNFQLTEIQPLISFSTFSEEDLKNHVNYYGSHQNLTFWNSGMTTNYSPHSLYSTSGSGSSEAGSQYLSEGNFPQKRSQSQNRTYRGRRNVYPNFRPHSFHENMFTPPDRFLARAHLIEIKECPDSLLNGTKWDHLSQSIWEKFMMSQQREETYRRKMYLWRYLYVTIKKAHPRYGLYLVGSTISGFGADTSDVDMCLVSRVSGITDPRMESVFNLNQLKEYLTTTGVFEQFNLIEAKVPILRFRDSMHNLEVDLNFNNCVGIRNTHLLHCYSQLDWRLRPMVLVTKLWAQYHNINNAKNMTISSYSLVLMVIHFLQFAIEPAVLPCLHEMYPEKFHILLKPNDFGFVDMNEEIDPYPSQNTQSLGELFLQFLEYYSNFDYTQYAISIRTGSLLPIEVCRQAKTAKNDNRQWKELCIEEPFDLTNTARSVYDCETFERIKAIFIASWKILQETMDLNAIFSPIVSATISQVPLSLTPTIS